MDTSATTQRAHATPVPTPAKTASKAVAMRAGSFADGQGRASERVGRFSDCDQLSH